MPDPSPPPPAEPTDAQPRQGNAARTAILAGGGGAVLFVLGAIAFDTGLIHHEDKADKQAAKTDAVSFQPPPMSAIPDGPEGESIRRGMAIFTNTGTNAKQFVGNGLSCQNCHLDAGRKPDSAPIDRKSVVKGKRVSVRVDLGGRRIIKKKLRKKNKRTRTTY